MEEDNAAPTQVAPTSDAAGKSEAVISPPTEESPAPAVEEQPKEDEEEEAQFEDEAESVASEASAEKPGAEEPVATGGRAKRERKKVAVLTMEVEAPKERVIPDGKGEKLEDMPNVVENFKKVTWSDPDLKVLYSFAFGVGKKKEFKGHLLQFSGIVYPEGKKDAEIDRLTAKMVKLTSSQLKAVMDLADIDRSAESFGDKSKGVTKDQLMDRFLEWLEEPKASGKKMKGASKKKSSGKRKSSGSAKDGAKKEKKTPAAKKKSEKKAPAAKSSPKKASASVVDIPGVDIDKLKAKVRSIVENADREELTVKEVRKILEDWLDTDLSEHKDAIRTLVMEHI